MATRGRKVEPEKEFKKFMHSMEEFLHRVNKIFEFLFWFNLPSFLYHIASLAF